MNKKWEVDPETRNKLLELQKQNGNDRCVDCGAPSPQWASPKFSIFICLQCSGIHRSLGVHISFIRSITMDSFKAHELALMGAGGNKPWRTFYDAHATNKLEGRTFEEATIAERYDGVVGEEWKERLAAKVEGREYVAPSAEERERRIEAAAAAASAKKKVGGEGGSRTASPAPYSNAMLTRTQSNLSSKAGSRSGSPALGTTATSSSSSRKAQNEAFFAKMGAENSTRPDDLPPSQGGKYAGFGSGWPPPERGGSDAIPTADEFQRDPVKALTRGFGWLSTTVGKAGQEGLKRLQEADLASQAQRAAMNIQSAAQNTWQVGSKGASDAFNRFVEGDDGKTPAHGEDSYKGDPDKKEFWDSFAAVGESKVQQRQQQQQKKKPAPERQDFWDEFASIGENRANSQHGGGMFGALAGGGAGAAKSKSSIGTAAMKKTSSGPAAKGGGGDDAWEEW